MATFTGQVVLNINFELPHSEACIRNSEPILKELRRFLKKGKLLEMGFGTAQHADFLAFHFPHIDWFGSDQEEYQYIWSLRFKNSPHKNLIGPFVLKCQMKATMLEQLAQQVDDCNFDYFFTANTLHIMSQKEVEIFCKEVSELLNPGAFLFIYGPFKYNGTFTSESNKTFDQSLRSRGLGSCIKDFEEINGNLNKMGINFYEKIELPANNEILIFKYE